MSAPLDPEIVRAHAEAMEKDEAFYRDPSSGLMVMTASKLAERGHCCGNGCRHCPYPAEEQARAGRPGSRR